MTDEKCQINFNTPHPLKQDFDCTRKYFELCDTYEITPLSSGRRHSPSTDASVIVAALDGGAPLI